MSVDDVVALFTFSNFLMVFPWLLNATSLTCAYCLSNSKVVAGRYIGVVAAIGWSCYGVFINELSFLFANIIFAWIYASAIYKFNSKRDEYKATFEEQKAEIERLEKEKRAEISRLEREKRAEIAKLERELDKKRMREEKALDEKREKIKRIAIRAEKNLLEIQELSRLA